MAEPSLPLCLSHPSFSIQETVQLQVILFLLFSLIQVSYLDILFSLDSLLLSSLFFPPIAHLAIESDGAAVCSINWNSARKNAKDLEATERTARHLSKILRRSYDNVECHWGVDRKIFQTVEKVHKFSSCHLQGLRRPFSIMPSQ